MTRPLLLPLTILLCSWILAPSGALAADSRAFDDYWYQGQAELTSYDLEQARYGEVHRGEAVLIFVTEDFSKAKQVKLDLSPTLKVTTSSQEWCGHTFTQLNRTSADASRLLELPRREGRSSAGAPGTRLRR